MKAALEAEMKDPAPLCLLAMKVMLSRQAAAWFDRPEWHYLSQWQIWQDVAHTHPRRAWAHGTAQSTPTERMQS